MVVGILNPSDFVTLLLREFVRQKAAPSFAVESPPRFEMVPVNIVSAGTISAGECIHDYKAHVQHIGLVNNKVNSRIVAQATHLSIGIVLSKSKGTFVPLHAVIRPLL